MDVEIGIMTGTPDKQKKLVLTSGFLAYLGNMAGTAAYYSVNNVTISEGRNFIEHTMPGRKGSVFQDMGRPAIKITIEGNISEDGIFYGMFRGGKGKNKIRLEELHELCDAGKPVDFLCDMPALFGVSSVIIQELEATEVKGRKHNYNYKLTLKEWSESKPSFDARSKYGFAKDALKKSLKKSIIVGAAAGAGLYLGHTLGTTYAPKTPELAVNIQMNKRIVTAEEVVEIKASVNDSKGNPIADADVKIKQGDSKELFSGKTNAEGIASAEFQSPDAGTYTIKATASKSDYKNGEASANITVDTQIKARMTTDKATITTSGKATLNVAVADCNGKAIEGVTVNLTCANTTISPASGTTDAKGSFTAEFSATAAGSYEVKATAKKSPYTDGNASITIKVT